MPVVVVGEQPAEGDADDVLAVRGDDADIAGTTPVAVVARELGVLDCDLEGREATLRVPGDRLEERPSDVTHVISARVPEHDFQEPKRNARHAIEGGPAPRRLPRPRRLPADGR